MPTDPKWDADMAFAISKGATPAKAHAYAVARATKQGRPTYETPAVTPVHPAMAPAPAAPPRPVVSVPGVSTGATLPPGHGVADLRRADSPAMLDAAQAYAAWAQTPHGRLAVGDKADELARADNYRDELARRQSYTAHRLATEAAEDAEARRARSQRGVEQRPPTFPTSNDKLADMAKPPTTDTPAPN